MMQHQEIVFSITMLDVLRAIEHRFAKEVANLIK